MAQCAILVVDDFQDIRNLLRVYLAGLEEVKLDVLEASSINEALDTAEKYKDEIKLLLMDVMMPGGSGFVVAKRIAQIIPEIKIIYMSAYYKTSRIGENDWIFTKPFDFDALTKIIKECLAPQ